MDDIVEQIGDTTVVTLPGDHLDASNSKAFKINLQPIVESATHLVIDLHNVQFIDSSGLGSILSCRRQLREKGGDLKLSQVTPQVKVLFDLVNAHRIIEFFDTSSDAINAFRRTNAA